MQQGHIGNGVQPCESWEMCTCSCARCAALRFRLAEPSAKQPSTTAACFILYGISLPLQVVGQTGPDLVQGYNSSSQHADRAYLLKRHQPWKYSRATMEHPPPHLAAKEQAQHGTAVTLKEGTDAVSALGSVGGAGAALRERCTKGLLPVGATIAAQQKNRLSSTSTA